MRIIFRTPSRRCPNRHLNGLTVEVHHQVGKKRVVRAGGTIPYYKVFGDYRGFEVGFIAFADELHIDPIVGKDVGDGSPVYASEVETGLAEEVQPPCRCVYPDKCFCPK